MRDSHYQPIANYGAIGNLRSVALVSLQGSIDWCCFPNLDDPSVFAAILDWKRGGRFSVGLVGSESQSQEYLGDTNVLVTTHHSAQGSLEIIDFMPLQGDLFTLGGSHAPAEIHRILRCTRGKVETHVEWSPRFDYAKHHPTIVQEQDTFRAYNQVMTISLTGAHECEVYDSEDGPSVRGTFGMEEGDSRALVTRWGTGVSHHSTAESLKQLEITAKAWEEWVHHEGVVRNEEWAGEYLPMVIRSELLLKMLSNAETGGFAAAPTTSLPETMGGVRNWDYRFCWIRDAAMTAQALISVGHESEALTLLDWMERVSAAHAQGHSQLQILYGIDGAPDAREFVLEHLEGYRGSHPVHIGNGAAQQLQLETFGELLSIGYELARRKGGLDPGITRFLSTVARRASDSWHLPDHGIWEMRTGPHHYTYSKIMSWVALDRACLLVRDFGMEGELDRWEEQKEKIREEILLHGHNSRLNTFTLHYDSDDLDAANLRIPMVDFLPADDPRVQGTIDITMRQLTDKGKVYRYVADDGLPGKEGAFGLCTFWLVDALALSGRVEEAKAIFEAMMSSANHLGLFSEQVDPANGEFLGNFPQAFTHIGFINSVLYLAYAHGKPLPERALIGSKAHRSELAPKET